MLSLAPINTPLTTLHVEVCISSTGASPLEHYSLHVGMLASKQVSLLPGALSPVVFLQVPFGEFPLSAIRHLSVRGIRRRGVRLLLLMLLNN